jgi:hypothetical protein
MLHLWLIPALAAVAGFVCVLYYVLHKHGGDGTRTEGLCVSDRGKETDAEGELGEGGKNAYLFIRTPPGYQAIQWTKSQPKNGSSDR